MKKIARIEMIASDKKGPDTNEIGIKKNRYDIYLFNIVLLININS